jgi:phosphoenolpyruvate-protein kinase (PTS system EI component)
MDKVKLKTLGDTPEKRYEMAVEQLQTMNMNVYNAFKNDMIKVMKEKQKKAEKNVNRVMGQLLKKLDDPALKNAMSKYIKKSDIESQFIRNLKKADMQKMKKFIKRYEALDKRVPQDVNALVKRYKKELLRIYSYWDETMPFGEAMSFSEQKFALGSLAGYYKKEIKYRESRARK